MTIFYLLILRVLFAQDTLIPDKFSSDAKPDIITNPLDTFTGDSNATNLGIGSSLPVVGTDAKNAALTAEDEKGTVDIMS